VGGNLARRWQAVSGIQTVPFLPFAPHLLLSIFYPILSPAEGSGHQRHSYDFAAEVPNCLNTVLVGPGGEAPEAEARRHIPITVELAVFFNT